MLVRVQGSRPENIQFLVHEVFESLIAESFHGVTYDFLFPCSDCLKVVSSFSLPDPSFTQTTLAARDLT